MDQHSGINTQFGCSSETSQLTTCDAALTPNSFPYGGYTLILGELEYDSVTKILRILLSEPQGDYQKRLDARQEAVAKGLSPPQEHLRGLGNNWKRMAFNVGDQSFPFIDGEEGSPFTTNWTFNNVELSWSDGQQIQLGLTSNNPPSVPRNFRATRGDDQVTINWNAPSSWGDGTAGHYRIQWRASYSPASAWSPVYRAGSIYEPEASVSSFVFAGKQEDIGDPLTIDIKQTLMISYVGTTVVSNWDSYTFRISAVSAQPKTASDWVEVSVDATAPPPPPTEFTVTPGNENVRLTWLAPRHILESIGLNVVTEVTGYDLHYTSQLDRSVVPNHRKALDRPPGFSYPDIGWISLPRVPFMRGTQGGTQQKTISGLTPGTTYRFRVRARNIAGSGEWAFMKGTTTGTKPPPPPAVSLSASPNSVGERGKVTVTVTLSQALSVDVDIPVAIPSAGVSVNIRIAAGETTGTYIHTAGDVSNGSFKHEQIMVIGGKLRRMTPVLALGDPWMVNVKVIDLPYITSPTTRRPQPQPTVTSPTNTVPLAATPRVTPTPTTTTTTPVAGGGEFVAPQRAAACKLNANIQVPGLLPFTDVSAGSRAAADIACIYTLKVTTGATPTTYNPTGTVTRAQMATFLARLYKTITGEPATVVDTPFTDLPANSNTAADIARIYNLNITTGATPTTYNPTGTVTRAQMATFLARLYRTLTTTL